MSDFKYIISKTQVIDGVVTTQPIGYTLSENDATTINADYESTYGDWVRANKNNLRDGVVQISSYFVSNPPVHSAWTKTTSVEGMELSLVNINDL